MKPNQLKHAWNAGRSTINGWLSIGSAFAAEIMAEQGYDSLTVDIQHGFLGFTAASRMLQAIRASGVTPLVRVPWLEPGIVMKGLDAGALGVICPMINNRIQAAEFVDAVRYPPLGNRSFGPTRANISAGPDYAAEANDNVLAIAMIETAEAVENLDSIVTVPGVDGLYIGPADLSISLSRGKLAPGMDREEALLVETINNVLQTAHAAGIRVGIHCETPEYAVRAIEWGFDMTTISSDARLLASASGATVRKARTLLGSMPSGDTENDQSGGY